MQERLPIFEINHVAAVRILQADVSLSCLGRSGLPEAQNQQARLGGRMQGGGRHSGVSSSFLSNFMERAFQKRFIETSRASLSTCSTQKRGNSRNLLY